MPKCDKCNKKSLLIFICKCDKSFCLKDKSPEDHNCSHVYPLFKLPYIPPAIKIKII